MKVLECIRRLLLASVVGLVAEDSTAAPVIGVLITLVFLYVFTRWTPFVDPDDNTLGIVLAYSLTLMFLAAVLIKADISGDFTHDQDVFGVVLSVVIFAGPCALVVQFTSRLFSSCTTQYLPTRKVMELKEGVEQSVGVTDPRDGTASAPHDAKRGTKQVHHTFPSFTPIKRLNQDGTEPQGEPSRKARSYSNAVSFGDVHEPKPIDETPPPEKMALQSSKPLSAGILPHPMSSGRENEVELGPHIHTL